MQHMHARVAVLALLLVVLGTTNPYLGIVQAHEFSLSNYDIETDVHIAEYDLLPQSEKTRIEESYARIFGHVEKLADIEPEIRLASALSDANSLTGDSQSEPTPTPTHAIQVASTEIDVSVLLSTKSSDTQSEKTADLTVEITEPEVASASISSTVAPAEIQSLIETYAPQYGADPAKMAVIAKCESGFRPEAVSPSGAYVGLYQFVSGTWVSNRNAMGLDPDPSLRANAEEAIKTAAFKMGRDGYGAWPVCGKI